MALIASPFAFSLLVDYSDSQWVRLANIGQAYGSVSVLISAIALLGVVGSLIMQRHQSRVAKVAASRERHWTLPKMAMEDPSLLECWGKSPILVDNDITITERRQMPYVNMILTYWHSEWMLRSMSETVLRGLLAQVLSSGPGQLFWSRVREYRKQVYGDDTFDAIVDDIYLRDSNADSNGSERSRTLPKSDERRPADPAPHG